MKTERKIAAFRLALFAALAVVASLIFAGCGTVSVECEGDGKWNAKIRNSWLRRDIDGFEANIEEGGKFSVKLNAVKSDVSEQVPAFTREMWSGLAILGRIAATAVNPAASAVPLTQEPANATDVAALVKANAELKAQVAAAKAATSGRDEARPSQTTSETSASSATSGSSSDCPNGSCERK